MTAGTDLGAPATDAAFSGGSARPVTFASNAGLVKRATLAVSGIRPGRYALMLRSARVDGLATYTAQAVVNQRVAGAVVTMDRPYGPEFGIWQDLGTFTLPPGLADTSVAAAGSFTIDIKVARTSGTGSVNLDALVLMPVELLPGEPGMRLLSLLDLMGAAPYVSRWDGDEEYHQTYNAGAAVSSNPAVLSGQFPVLTPGRRNVLHLFRQASPEARVDGLLGDQRADIGNANQDKIAMTTTVTVSYMPRWLHLAGS